MRVRALAVIAALLVVGVVVWAQSQAPVFPDARASDPVALGWMAGSPPPANKTVRFADGSFYKFPQTRWAFSHMRELVPTVAVSRGTGPVSALPRAERRDLDAVTFTPIGQQPADDVGAPRSTPTTPTASSSCTAAGSSTNATRARSRPNVSTSRFR